MLHLNHCSIKQTLGRLDRIRHAEDYRAILAQPPSAHSRFFLAFVLPQRSNRTRLGITVGRKVGSAVVRNRIKRIVREVFRRHRSLFPNQSDTVIVARAPATRLDYKGAFESILNMRLGDASNRS